MVGHSDLKEMKTVKYHFGDDLEKNLTIKNVEEELIEAQKL